MAEKSQREEISKKSLKIIGSNNGASLVLVFIVVLLVVMIGVTLLLVFIVLLLVVMIGVSLVLVL